MTPLLSFSPCKLLERLVSIEWFVNILNKWFLSPIPIHFLTKYFHKAYISWPQVWSRVHCWQFIFISLNEDCWKSTAVNGSKFRVSNEKDMFKHGLCDIRSCLKILSVSTRIFKLISIILLSIHLRIFVRLNWVNP